MGHRHVIRIAIIAVRFGPEFSQHLIVRTECQRHVDRVPEVGLVDAHERFDVVRLIVRTAAVLVGVVLVGTIDVRAVERNIAFVEGDVIAALLEDAGSGRAVAIWSTVDEREVVEHCVRTIIAAQLVLELYYGEIWRQKLEFLVGVLLRHAYADSVRTVDGITWP